LVEPRLAENLIKDLGLDPRREKGLRGLAFPITSLSDVLRAPYEPLLKADIKMGAFVINRPDLTRSGLYRTAAHEYGHMISISGLEGRELTSEAKLARQSVLQSKKHSHVLKRLEDQLTETLINKGRPVNIVIPEVAAEAVSVYRQSHLLKKGARPLVSPLYFPQGLTETEIRTMYKLGKGIERSSPIAKRLAKISGVDDAYNSIQALPSGPGAGMAGVSRETLDIPFGTGWHRDVNWTLPYQLSLTQDRLGPYFSDHALQMAGTISRSTTDIPYQSLANVTMSAYTARRPDVLEVPIYPPDMDASTFNQWGGIGLEGPAEGLQHGGYSGDMRAYRTGFGSGWKGLDATLSASTDFIGVQAPNLNSSSLESKLTYNRGSGGYEYPPVQIKVQTVSPSRPGVDHNLRQLQVRNEHRKIRDQFRKTSMAELQTTTSANMFLASKYGAKKHKVRGQ
jgi:hypothetical protein